MISINVKYAPTTTPMTPLLSDFVGECPLWLVAETIPYIMIEGLCEEFFLVEDLKEAMVREAKPRPWKSKTENEFWCLIWLAVANDKEAMEFLFNYQRDFYWSWNHSDHNAELDEDTWHGIITRVHSEVFEHVATSYAKTTTNGE